MSDLAWLGVAEAARRLRAGALSPVALTEALLARIGRLDGRLNSFLAVRTEEALGEARDAARELAAGRWRGPLHGVPLALKDIIDVAGVPTTAHSKILADNVPDADATVTRRLRAAGAVLLGKTATHEFALGGPAFDLPWPPARNPWDTSRHPGGSSSGSGAAVAAGLAPAALGSDTGGSVRNPASCCGIVGMKATYGLVSRAGVVPLAQSLDHIGPMTRTVEDNALLLNVLAGHDPADPASLRRPQVDFAGQIGRPVRGLRIGVIRHFWTRDYEADPEMAAALDAALGVLEALGAELRDIELPPLGEYAACNRVILTSEAYSVHERWLKERPGDYGALTRQRLLPGALLSAADYLRALKIRAKLRDAYGAAMDGLDAAVTASAMDPPCRIDDPEAVERTYGRQARTPFNLIGCPALAVPIGFSRDGLPLSMQIVGPAFAEPLLYRIGHAYEQAAAWTARRPEIA